MQYSNLLKRSEQALIVILHLVLLKWIFYALYEAGSMTTKEITLHFLGLALFGAFLIRGTAFLVQKRYLKENNLTKLPK